ncbi:LOW QUALITY PROTEIN: sterile alpha motif domain-containing protein 3 [Sphaerodactylus townsendi]|uniref:LOW QUALITY PROTEIN: sterile alpha motif domain-containing protein 3 n=1 Tax=Sphaerodactylus townsendi TaxID=933632 RepID=UPI002025DC51|nr:LOW QUALITY PROTEIN: sterile alpha motif domain-containing protein 3 [Sphaerodactylus townsendi]
MKIEKWSDDQVCIWLVQKNLGDLVPKFCEEEVSGAAFLALNDRMVQQLVKKIGHQALLMDLIMKCKKTTTMKYVFARYKSVQLTNSYILPEFPDDVKCILAERKCPDHSMRIRIIEFLQADMTKHLKGSL